MVHKEVRTHQYIKLLLHYFQFHSCWYIHCNYTLLMCFLFPCSPPCSNWKTFFLDCRGHAMDMMLNRHVDAHNKLMGDITKQLLTHGHHSLTVDKPLQHLYSPTLLGTRSPTAHHSISPLSHQYWSYHLPAVFRFHCTVELKWQ